MGSKNITIYCDGGCYDATREVNWAFVVVKDNKIINELFGSCPYGGNHNANVESAEAHAVWEALAWCTEHEGNYILCTDSRSMLDKIEGKVPNATKQPMVKAIQNMLDYHKKSPKPISATIKYVKRRSNEFSKRVDDLCESQAKRDEVNYS